MSNSSSLAAAIAAPALSTATQASGPVTVPAQTVNAVAQNLKALPPHLHPYYNPAAFRTLPAEMQVAIRAAAPQVLANAPPATRDVTMDLSQLEGVHGYEAAGAIDPRTGLLRLPAARLEVCGAAVTVLSNAITTATIKWNPQRDFKGVRLLFPSAEAVENSSPTYIQNLLVGNKPIYLGTGNESIELFSELATSGLVDFPICRVGITISATLSNAGLAASTNHYSAILGYVTDGKAVEPLKGFLRRMAIPPQIITAGSSFTYGLNPQDAFKVRKFAIDQAIAGSFIVTAVNIGNEPQLLSGDPIPAQAFSDRAQDVWVDWDRCKTGQQIFLSVTNISGSTANFQGAFLGDVDESNPNY